jgi:hypothetical protein
MELLRNVLKEEVFVDTNRILSLRSILVLISTFLGVLDDFFKLISDFLESINDLLPLFGAQAVVLTESFKVNLQEPSLHFVVPLGQVLGYYRRFRQILAQDADRLEREVSFSLLEVLLELDEELVKFSSLVHALSVRASFRHAA